MIIKIFQKRPKLQPIVRNPNIFYLLFFFQIRKDQCAVRCWCSVFHFRIWGIIWVIEYCSANSGPIRFFSSLKLCCTLSLVTSSDKTFYENFLKTTTVSNGGKEHHFQPEFHPEHKIQCSAICFLGETVKYFPEISH